MNKQSITIDVFSDIVCPWCYIGKRRLEGAIQRLSSNFVFDITYHPFELNPTLPASGLNQKEYLVNKFGGLDRYMQITEHVTRIAALDGLTFDFEKQTTAPNTRDAHRLVWWAKSYTKQAELTESLMKAYFTDGINLSLTDSLVTIGEAIGLPGHEAKNFLKSTEGLAEVEEAEDKAFQLRITSVPFYIINSKFGLSGAQPVEAFIEATEASVKNQ
ncbi:MAG: DsbA family oxidoreductase [Cyclobacteriaceae bacterium]|nr:DsbA family oxidoreductase [Cyclobacteriaceae bacterium]